MGDGGPGKPPLGEHDLEVSEQQEQQQQIVRATQDLFRRDLASWAADDYILNGRVQVDGAEECDSNTDGAKMLVEDPAKRGGQRFSLQPVWIKVDTGSAADLPASSILGA